MKIVETMNIIMLIEHLSDLGHCMDNAELTGPILSLVAFLTAFKISSSRIHFSKLNLAMRFTRHLHIIMSHFICLIYQIG